MSHVSADGLSTYLDGEMGARASRRVEEHLAGCGACQERLEGLRTTVQGLRRLERVAPPAAIGERVRRAVARQPTPSRFWSRVRASLSFDGGLPALSTPLAMVLAVFVSLLLVEHQASWLGSQTPWSVAERWSAPAPRPEFRVVAEFGEEPLVLPQTTSEVAGRVFVLTDDGWVQRGLDGSAPAARVNVQSAQGRRLLAQLSDLGVLLADGSRVVLRYQLRTLELSN
jgi:hypothetical protein